MTWSTGSERIQQLLDAGELEDVEPSLDVARRLLTDAEQHIVSARTIAEAGDLTGAYQLAYDALRKTAASLLAAQGLRATSRGGHVAVQDAVIAQFGDEARVFRAFGRLRRSRNRFEYPGDTASEPTVEDVNDALQVSAEAAEKSTTILDRGVLSPWRS